MNNLVTIKIKLSLVIVFIALGALILVISPTNLYAGGGGGGGGNDGGGNDAHLRNHDVVRVDNDTTVTYDITPGLNDDFVEVTNNDNDYGHQRGANANDRDGGGPYNPGPYNPGPYNDDDTWVPPMNRNPGGGGPGSSGSSGGSSSDPSVPQVILEVKNASTSGNWNENGITIKYNEDVYLKWSSTYVEDGSCASGDFDVSDEGVVGANSGTQEEVDEPTSNSKTYTIQCERSDSINTGPETVRDDVTVTIDALPPELDVEPKLLKKSEDATLSWDLNGNDPGSCSLTGPGINMDPMGSNSGWPGSSVSGENQTGSEDVTINGYSIFNLECPVGTASTTVEILPVIEET